MLTIKYLNPKIKKQSTKKTYKEEIWDLSTKWMEKENRKLREKALLKQVK
jgi:hypothetical protein